MENRLKPDFFASFADQIMILEEHLLHSADVAGRDEFARLGLTDTGIVHLVVQEKLLVLTDDFPLSNYLQTQGIDVINYNHIRPIY